MAESVKPQLVFVHGIGGPRDAEAERVAWLKALAEGARSAGHSDAVSGLGQDWLADSRFANYSDLFAADGAQGSAERAVDEAEPAFLEALLRDLVDELDHQAAERGDGPDVTEVIADARFLLDAGVDGAAEPQGVTRILVQVATKLMQLPGIQTAAQWASGKSFLLAVSQVGRYLSRGELDASGRPLDARVRERVLDGIDPDRPLVVVSHSLGSVVAYEALHLHKGPIALWVTLGSPLATGAVVLQRLDPKPPRTPGNVHRWLNFWDRDDVVVARPRVEKWMKPNDSGVAPVTARVDSDGAWVHTATKYLRQAAVAGPIVEALKR